MGKVSTTFIVSIMLVGGIVFFISEGRFIIRERVPQQDISTVHTISEGSTFAAITEQAGLSSLQTASLIDAVKNVYDLGKITAGRKLAFIYTPGGKLKGLRYEIDTEERLIVEQVEEPVVEGNTLPAATGEIKDQWNAHIEKIPYEVQYERAEGTIESSLYETVTKQGLDQRLAIALSEVFAWQIDFALDIQKGDEFRVYYEKRYLDGEYVMPGRILAAEFTNSGTTYAAYYFRGVATKAGYYNENGEALQKQFLKSPLQYKYISSGYTTKIRRVSSLGLARPHRGIDYAASYGTPAVSIGDGTVARAGWDKYLGLSVVVRHNETYESVYGHFQSLAKGIKRGAHVSQGQVVGYVGSTGYSTGPHLHFEIHKYASHVNPLTVEAPPSDPVHESDKELFTQTLAHLKKISGI